MNGITYSADGHHFEEKFEMGQSLQADIFALTETNLEWQQHTVVSTMHKTANDTFGAA